MSAFARAVCLLALIGALGACATRWDHVPSLEEIPPREGSVHFSAEAGRALVAPAPDYPRDAWANRREGWVLVSGILQADGSLADIRVLASEPPGLFDRSALDSYARFRYRPPVDSVGPLREVRYIFRFRVAPR